MTEAKFEVLDRTFVLTGQTLLTIITNAMGAAESYPGQTRHQYVDYVLDTLNNYKNRSVEA